jgi:hypothetical protein
VVYEPLTCSGGCCLSELAVYAACVACADRCGRWLT